MTGMTFVVSLLYLFATMYDVLLVTVYNTYVVDCSILPTFICTC